LGHNHYLCHRTVMRCMSFAAFLQLPDWFRNENKWNSQFHLSTKINITGKKHKKVNKHCKQDRTKIKATLTIHLTSPQCNVIFTIFICFYTPWITIAYHDRYNVITDSKIVLHKKLWLAGRWLCLCWVHYHPVTAQ